MSANGHSEARRLRSRLNHPIIDADGPWLEYSPVMREEFRRIGGEAAAEALAIASERVPSSLKMSLAERTRRRVGQEAFWGSPCANVLDRATAMLPRLMYERLDDLGMDFCVVYPTAGLGYHRMQDTRLRRAICRAYNVFNAVEFLLQPHRPLRLGRPRRLQGALLRRHHPALSRPELRVPRGGRGLGVHALRRSHRPLGQAQSTGARGDEPS